MPESGAIDLLRRVAAGGAPMGAIDLAVLRQALREVDRLWHPAPPAPSATYVVDLEAQLVDARAQLAAALAAEHVAVATLERFERSLTDLKLEVADPQVTGRP